MADKRLKFDGVEAYLANDLNAGATTISFTAPLTHDGGTNMVPDISFALNGEYMVLTILTSNYVLKEIVYLTEYVQGATTGTIVRGQEGTNEANGGYHHADGVKVVHAPTAMDFLVVQDHEEDPTAHQAQIIALANAAAASALAAHVAESNPHDQYVLKSAPQFSGNLTIPSGRDLIIESGARLWVKSGGRILVDGTLEISSTGVLIINGKRLHISNTAPSPASKDMVWIQTFGA